MPSSPNIGNPLIRDFTANDSMDQESKRLFLETLALIARSREDIKVFANEMLGVPLNDFQSKFLSMTTTPRSQWPEKFGVTVEEGSEGGLLYGFNIACPSNQVGKTVMTAIKHIDMCYFKNGLNLSGELFLKAFYSTLNISPSSRQTKACYSYIKEILEERFVIDENGVKRTNKLHPLMKGFIIGDNTNLGEIRFANGSVMFSVPIGHDQAASLAGGQYGYISYDEAAQSLHLKNELGAKILSRLIKYGVGIDLISTPEVDSPSHQDYSHMVKLGLAYKEGYFAMTGNLDQNRFIPQEQRDRIKAQLLSVDKKKYRQVVFGEFITGGKRFFETEEISQLWRLAGRIPCTPGRKYLLVADWGMADGGDPSVFYVLDYTDWLRAGKIFVVAHEQIEGGSPTMQFALLRTLYEAYSYSPDEGSMVMTTPIFVMDAAALGGVTIKKLLANLNPKGFDIDKDEALLLLKNEMGSGRSFKESEVDGSIIELNEDFGSISSYYIDELNTQLGNYHIDDKKLTQDHVMVLMMGVAYIVRRWKRNAIQGKPAVLNPLASYNAGIRNITQIRRIPVNNQ